MGASGSGGATSSSFRAALAPPRNCHLCLVALPAAERGANTLSRFEDVFIENGNGVHGFRTCLDYRGNSLTRKRTPLGP